MGRRLSDFLPAHTKEEISAELAEVVRQAVVGAGEEKIVVIGHISIQLNVATGGGDTVEVRNK